MRWSWKWSITFLLIMVVVFAFSETLPLMSRTLSGKNLRLRFPKPLSIFGLAKQIFCHLNYYIGFPDILGRRKWSYQPPPRMLVTLFWVTVMHCVNKYKFSIKILADVADYKWSQIFVTQLTECYGLCTTHLTLKIVWGIFSPK